MHMSMHKAVYERVVVTCVYRVLYERVVVTCVYQVLYKRSDMVTCVNGQTRSGWLGVPSPTPYPRRDSTTGPTLTTETSV